MEISSNTFQISYDPYFSPKVPTNIIPQEILLNIFSKLGDELPRTALVCKSWKTISRDNTLKPIWELLIKELLPSVSLKNQFLADVLSSIHEYDQKVMTGKWSKTSIQGNINAKYYGIPRSKSHSATVCAAIGDEVEVVKFSLNTKQPQLKRASDIQIDPIAKTMSIDSSVYRYSGKLEIDEVIRIGSHMIPIFHLKTSLFAIDQYWDCGDLQSKPLNRFVFTNIESIYGSSVDSKKIYVEGDRTKVYLIDLATKTVNVVFKYNAYFHFDALYHILNDVHLQRGPEREGINLYLRYETAISDILQVQTLPVKLMAASSFEVAIVTKSEMTIYNLQNRKIPEIKLTTIKGMDVLTLSRISNHAYMASCISHQNEGVVAIWSVPDKNWIRVEKNIFNASRVDLFKHSIPTLQNSKLFAIKNQGLDIYTF